MNWLEERRGLRLRSYHRIRRSRSSWTGARSRRKSGECWEGSKVIYATIHNRTNRTLKKGEKVSWPIPTIDLKDAEHDGIVAAEGWVEKDIVHRAYGLVG